VNVVGEPAIKKNDHDLCPSHSKGARAWRSDISERYCVRRALYPAYIALPRVGVAVLFVLVRCERPARLCVAERLRCRASNALRPCCVRLQRRATGAGHSIPPPAVRHDVAICHAGPAGEKCAQAYSHIPGIPRVCVRARAHTHTHTHTHTHKLGAFTQSHGTSRG